MTKRDAICVTAIGAEVGLLFQPIILNLWPDISVGLVNVLGTVPSQTTVQLAAFVGFTILAPLALFILSLLAKLVQVFFQIGKFAAVGSSNSFVDIGLLNLVIMLVGIEKGSTEFLIAATATAFAGTVNSFAWNKFWTFEAGKTADDIKKALAEVVKFYAVTGVAALVNGGATYAASNVITGVSDDLVANIAKIVGIFSGMALNFLGYKFFVFKKVAPPPPAAPPPQAPPKML